MKCQYCGAELPEGSKFCNKCGKELGEVTQEIITEDSSKLQEQHPANECQKRKKGIVFLFCFICVLTLSVLFAMVFVTPEDEQQSVSIPSAEPDQTTGVLTETVTVAAVEEISESKSSTEAETVKGEDDIPTGIVLLNADGVFAEFRGIEEDSPSSWIVNIYVENNRDSEIYFSIRENCVNGYVLSLANNGATIPAGGKYMSSPKYDFIIDTDKLREYGISQIDSLDFTISVATSFLGDTISETPVHLDILKTVAGTENTTPRGTGQVLYEDDSVYVEYCGIVEYSKSTWILNLYVENKLDSQIYIFLSDNMFNGYSINFANNGVFLPANSKYLSSPNFDLVIDLDDLQAYGISTLDSITFALSVCTSMFGDTLAETDIFLPVVKNVN